MRTAAKCDELMQRLHQFVFTASLVALCWLMMQVVHEAGHVVGAWASGGAVERVVLHPLAISRTDVATNPRPGTVVWAGPLVGCIVPLLAVWRTPKRYIVTRKSMQFFAGFCLVANGAYIAIGSFDGVGDAGVMLDTGSPQWLLLAFGAATVPVGFWQWHRLGSPRPFLVEAEGVAPRNAYVALGMLLFLTALECLLSPR